mmetsp:Transcript_41730/g.73363  ORF Transcript_41730/g.73363 Transcript_41730/m.73363 type:complete len:474 (-) Transcript_41730:191-1612(-)
MRLITLTLACIAYAGHGRRLQESKEVQAEEPGEASLKDLASLFLASKPAAAWQAGVPAARAKVARVPATQMADSALIIQNKGGGHGEIGYHLALELAKEKGVKVTILHEGPNKADKPPHSAYSDLAAAGVEVNWFDSLDSPEAVGSVAGKKFDAVVDNWSKSPEQIKPYADLAKQWGVENYAYISSAGMYTPPKGDYSGISEEVAVKSSGQRQAEELLAEMQLPYSCFRPQYIYGPKQGKSYLKYFFDRVTRGRPVLIPNGGQQQVTMTHAADNAGMVAAAVGNAAAAGQVFNCATSSLITYDELAAMCAKAAGKGAPEIIHYDPKDFDIPKGFFPFRDTPFFVVVDKAASKLGFVPKNFLSVDIDWYYQNNYVATGAPNKEVDFALDDEIIAKAGAPSTAGGSSGDLDWLDAMTANPANFASGAAPAGAPPTADSGKAPTTVADLFGGPKPAPAPAGGASASDEDMLNFLSR